MSPTLRILASLFLLIATVTLNANAAPKPPDAPPGEELPFGALARIGSAKFPFRDHDKKNDPILALLQIAFSPDGKWLAALGHDDVLLLLDAKTGKLVRKIDATSKLGETARSCAFAPDSNTIAISNGVILSVPEGGTVAAFNAKVKDPGLVAFSPDGKKIALAATDSIALFDAKKGGNLLRKDVNFKSVSALAFAPDGKSIAVAGERDTTKPKEKIEYPIVIYDTEKLAWITTLDAGLVRSVSFIDKKLVTSHDNGTVRIWDVDKEKVLSTYKGHPGDVRLAA